MIRDVFYYGKKPNAHPREKFAKDLKDARQQATTEHFWIINEFSDYKNFDWDFDFELLPDEDVWAKDHNNVWPSQHQKDGGTWLCPKIHSDIIIYRADVEPVYRKNEITDNWVFLDKIDISKFDFSWHPDPTDPPFIYKWGNKFYPVELTHVLEYHVEGANDTKYMNNIVELLPNYECLVEYQKVDKEKFDLSWRPDPRDPPYIYVWGNKYIPGEIKPTFEYIVAGATEKKYMGNNVPVLPQWDRWNILLEVENTFDFSWRPDPREPDFIYVFGNTQYPANIMPTLEYRVPGATQIKYVSEDLPKLKSKPEKFTQLIPVDSFDFSWRPNPHDPPYIYVFGNQCHDVYLEPTLEYRVPGATQKKYITDIVASTKVFYDNWKELIPVEKFDYSWRPHPHDPPYIYVFGNQWHASNIEPTIEYHVPGATEKKYVTDVVAYTKPDTTNWKELLPVEYFDYSWRPNPHDPPYIYVFGNQWHASNIEPTIEYHVPGTTEKKYVTDIVAYTKPSRENWKELIPVENFDYSWRPNPHDPPYIYVFGNQFYDATVEPTLEYHVPGATEKKYITDIIARTKIVYENWKQLIPVENFDFSWRPHPHDPPYIYVFGNQWHASNIEPTLEYRMPGATEKKYITDIVARTKVVYENWKELIPVENFDYSWRPNPHDPPYIYVFGNQWHASNIEPTIEYHVPGATQRKYIKDIVAYTKPEMTCWIIKYEVKNFDYSWRPDPHSPPMIYQFGTLLEDVHLKDGPVYVVPGNDGTVVYLENVINEKIEINYPKYYIETTLDNLIKEHPEEIFWALRKNINYDEFDFSWKPEKSDVFNINVFGSPESETTQTYFVNGPLVMKGYSQRSYVDNIKLNDEYLSKLFKPMDMFYVDKGNTESNNRFESLKIKYPNIKKTRYLNSWVDTINRCLNKCETELCWVLNSELDYTDFDFAFYPNPWQMKMVHVFGTQWSHWGTTFVVNKETFPSDTKYVKVIEHLPNINFVKKTKAKATNCLYEVYFIDYGNSESESVYNSIRDKIKSDNVYKIQYDKTYLRTIRKILEEIPIRKDHYIWVCSSIIDYSNFDFSYIIDPFTKDQLHVFPADKQRFGDTFFFDVNKLRTVIDKINLLDEIDKINLNGSQRTSRMPCPIIVHNDDTHTSVVNTDFNFPYALFKTKDNENIKIDTSEPPILWGNKSITILSEGATNLYLPNVAKKYVTSELYDYPYIVKAKNLAKSKPLDIVFLSNGEENADENYEHLLKVTKGLPNRVVRVDGVKGRVNAYHAAAKASDTPWMFTVFAKLKVNENFNWDWQPDRLQIPKHYIFYATNPVNDLEYGHQAMIAYNKQITLENKGVGLDFTLDSEHQVVEVNSGVAVYNTDPFTTWRTSFREALKLRADKSKVSKERLQIWLTVGKGNFSEYSIQGAKDAVKYYEEVNGEIEKLRLSYDWDWLEKKFNK